jgi:glutamate dehydrogenase/leucine dehydrogenase
MSHPISEQSFLQSVYQLFDQAAGDPRTSAYVVAFQKIARSYLEMGM